LDVESLDTVTAPFESGFSVPPAPAFRQSAVIFSSTKLSAQPFCPAIPEDQQPDDPYYRNHCDGNDYGNLCGTQCWYVHDLPPVF
jgi:hypothetical protein